MASALAEVTVYIDSNDPVYAARFQELLAENERYRRALEFYANSDNYMLDWEYTPKSPIRFESEVQKDSGVRARAALTPPDNGIAESE